jgi:hypothetical protein
MAKQDKGTPQKNDRTTEGSGATTADAVQQRVLAFAEQVGRIAGTLQAKADGWMQRETLQTQIASVRDGAADLLEPLAGGATKASKRDAGRLQGAARHHRAQRRRGRYAREDTSEAAAARSGREPGR